MYALEQLVHQLYILQQRTMKTSDPPIVQYVLMPMVV